MNLENKLEGTEIDNTLGVNTSTSDEIVSDTPVPELNSSPAPTNEEVEDAKLNSEPVGDALVSDGQPISNENVDKVVEENGVTDTPALKTYTQEDLNDIAGKTRVETRMRTFRYVYDRYGVQDEAGLDELIGNAQRYDSLQEKYDAEKKGWEEQSSARDKELADIKEQVALMQSGIDNDRFDDAKLILKGKGLEVNLENINQALSTHPEWKKASQEHPEFQKVEQPQAENKPAEPVSTISVLGNDNSVPANTDEEDEAFAMKHLFKV